MKLTHLQLLNSIRLFRLVCQQATWHMMSNDNHPLFDDLEYIAYIAILHTYVPRYLCPTRPMFLGTYVPPYLGSPDLCSSVPMFPGTYVPHYLCSPVPMFPRTYVPHYLCCPVPTYPRTYVPQYLCSPVPMFPRNYVLPYLCCSVPMFPGTYVPRTYVRPTYVPPVPMLSGRGDWRWWGKFCLGRCPPVPNESKYGNTNDVFGEHVPTALTGAKRIIDAGFASEISQKINFDNESRFLSSNFELGWTASDMARCGKGLYEDYATCMS